MHWLCILADIIHLNIISARDSHSKELQAAPPSLSLGTLCSICLKNSQSNNIVHLTTSLPGSFDYCPRPWVCCKYALTNQLAVTGSSAAKGSAIHRSVSHWIYSNVLPCFPSTSFLLQSTMLSVLQLKICDGQIDLVVMLL